MQSNYLSKIREYNAFVLLIQGRKKQDRKKMESTLIYSQQQPASSNLKPPKPPDIPINTGATITSNNNPTRNMIIDTPDLNTSTIVSTHKSYLHTLTFNNDNYSPHTAYEPPNLSLLIDNDWRHQ